MGYRNQPIKTDDPHQNRVTGENTKALPAITTSSTAAGAYLRSSETASA
jgi:hypothetical protein